MCIAILVVILMMNASFNLTYAETQNHKAHVHGAAILILAMETEITGSIDLDSAADSIMGFEHEAKSKADQAAKIAAFKMLRDQAASIIKFDKSLGCTVTATKVEMEKEAHGQHADINASFSVSCKKPVSGSQVEIGLIGMFPKLKKVSLQILSSSTQTQSDVNHEHTLILVP